MCLGHTVFYTVLAQAPKRGKKSFLVQMPWFRLGAQLLESQLGTFRPCVELSNSFIGRLNFLICILLGCVRNFPPDPCGDKC
jgi:hypothetical protein